MIDVDGFKVCGRYPSLEYLMREVIRDHQEIIRAQRSSSGRYPSLEYLMRKVIRDHQEIIRGHQAAGINLSST